MYITKCIGWQPLKDGRVGLNTDQSISASDQRVGGGGILRATPMGVVKCHFATLDSVLTPMNSIFAPIVGVKMGCHFNNSMFFIKKNIIKLAKYGM